MVLPQDSYLRFGPYLDLMTGIRTALNINEGIIKVVAPEGCGKTALCRTLASDLRAEGQDVIFFESPPESVEYLHQRIQSELDLPRDRNFTRSLTNYLLARSPPNNKLIIIYDDAEKISKDIFILIRLLNNVHDTSDTLVSQVICGTPKLDRVFDDPDLRSLTQYLNQSFTLAPMSRDELEDFYSGYRKLAGVTGPDLSNKELTDLFILGKGLPGKTFDLIEQRLKRTASEETVTPADAASIAVTAPGAAAGHYAREVDTILDEDAEQQGNGPIYFKAALSLIVVVSTIVLAFVLSNEDPVAPSSLESLLADDSPLYLDEVTPEPPPIDAVEIPVLGGTGETSLADVDDSAQSATEIDAAPAIGTGSVEGVAVALNTGSDAEVGEPLEVITPTAVASAPESNEPDLVADTDTDDMPEPAEDVSASADPPSLETTLTGVLEQWLDAWEGGDFPGYLAAYHDAFTSPYHDSREAWISEREARVDGVTGISVSLDRFELLESSPESATVRFWLYYSRGSYADETHKEIMFSKVDEAWLIRTERNLELIVR